MRVGQAKIAAFHLSRGGHNGKRRRRRSGRPLCHRRQRPPTDSGRILDRYGFGRIDANRAVQLVAELTPVH